MSVVKKTILFALVALIVFSALQVEPVESAQKSDLIFVKGKFIKKDKKGVIVVDDKEHCSCHHGRK